MTITTGTTLGNNLSKFADTCTSIVSSYAAFSRDMSSAMKLVISKEVFQGFRTESEATLGRFQYITSIEQGESDSTSSSWVVSAEFENSTEQFTITFDQTTGQIEGMDFVPAG